MRTAQELTYPVKPNSKGRASVYWRGDNLDLGKFGTSESLLTFFHLRAHLIDGGAAPKMASFRRSIVQEHGDANTAEAEQLRVDLAHQRKLVDDTKKGAEEELNDWQAKSEKLKRIAVVSSMVCVAMTLASVVSLWRSYSTPTLSNSELQLVEDLSEKKPGLVSSNPAGWVDNEPLTDQEIGFVRGMRKHAASKKLSVANSTDLGLFAKNFVEKGIKDVPKINAVPELGLDLPSNRYTARRVATGEAEETSSSQPTAD